MSDKVLAVALIALSWATAYWFAISVSAAPWQAGL